MRCHRDPQAPVHVGQPRWMKGGGNFFGWLLLWPVFHGGKKFRKGRPRGRGRTPVTLSCGPCDFFKIFFCCDPSSAVDIFFEKKQMLYWEHDGKKDLADWSGLPSLSSVGRIIFSGFFSAVTCLLRQKNNVKKAFDLVGARREGRPRRRERTPVTRFC